MRENKKILMFTAENPNNMTKKLDLKGKDILTVTNSGDQALNFLLEGAKSIKLFDINPNSEFYFYLKKALIEKLSYQEFLNFYFPGFFNKKDFFSKEKYEMIKNNLPEGKIRSYWDNIFNNYTHIGIQNIFVKRGYNKKDIIKRNNYLQSEENYNMLKERLKSIKNVEFEEIDILHELLYLKDPVDFIFLSDILNYIPSTNSIEYLKKLKALTLNISYNLKDNGIISVSYMHCYLDEYLSSLGNIQSIVSGVDHSNTFLKNECDLISFKGGYIPDSNRLKDRDAVILYKKKIKKK